MILDYTEAVIVMHDLEMLLKKKKKKDQTFTLVSSVSSVSESASLALSANSRGLNMNMHNQPVVAKQKSVPMRVGNDMNGFPFFEPNESKSFPSSPKIDGDGDSKSLSFMDDSIMTMNGKHDIGPIDDDTEYEFDGNHSYGLYDIDMRFDGDHKYDDGRMNHKKIHIDIDIE